MKRLPWLLVVLLAIACAAAGSVRTSLCRQKSVPKQRYRRLSKTDTVLISAPIAVFWQILPNDTVRIGDTLLHRKRVVYEDSLYRAVVSGYVDPQLDSMTVYLRTVYQVETNDVYHPVTIKSKKKRWGFGLQAGYGYLGVFYVGVGVSYDLWQW